MDNEFEGLPKEMGDALRVLAKVSEKHQIPLFCLVPIPFDPCYISNYDHSFTKLSETNLLFITELLSIQYHYIASIQYEPEMVDYLRTMKDFDPNFKSNAKKYLKEAGLQSALVDSLVYDASTPGKVDYSFTQRLGERNAKK